MTEQDSTTVSIPDTTPERSWLRSLIPLGPAAIFLLFANGRHPLALAAWLAPVFLLRFTRRCTRSGMFLAWLLLTCTWAFQFRGMAPLPPVGYALLSAAYGLILILPFVADRLLAPRLAGLSATLVLPTAWATIEYLVATLSPYGSWGAVAYSQFENLALMQIVSLTGIYGLGFLIAWFATAANWVLDHDFAWLEIRRVVITFSATFMLVLAFGEARLTLAAPSSTTIRVASLSRPDFELIPNAEVSQRIATRQSTSEDIEEIRRRAERINEDLLSRSEREARAGAKIIFWGETNAFAFKKDEASLIERAAYLAQKYEIYLGLGLGIWNADAERPLENKLVLIDPQGTVLWEAFKAIPIPGPEAAISARDDGQLNHSDTPFGRLGAVICFDMDFPGLLQQAGRAGVDLMLVPSNDWQEIDPWHTHMARFRAVEQGFNLVRHVSSGFSAATDYQGRVLNTMDHFTADNQALISQVPTRGVPTVYAKIGDVFAWLCALGLLALFYVGLRKPVGEGR